MDYKLTAVDESDPRWNQRMEDWWNQGGALLWNRLGGFGSDTLILMAEELERFLHDARAIDGWDSRPYQGFGAEGDDTLFHPIRVEPYHEEIREDDTDSPHCETSSICCRNCGRPIHAILREHGDVLVPVPRTQLNHVLHCLEEAVSFGRGEGPNNYRTWEAMLLDLLDAMSRQK